MKKWMMGLLFLPTIVACATGRSSTELPDGEAGRQAEEPADTDDTDQRLAQVNPNGPTGSDADPTTPDGESEDGDTPDESPPNDTEQSGGGDQGEAEKPCSDEPTVVIFDPEGTIGHTVLTRDGSWREIAIAVLSPDGDTDRWHLAGRLSSRESDGVLMLTKTVNGKNVTRPVPYSCFAPKRGWQKAEGWCPQRECRAGGPGTYWCNPDIQRPERISRFDATQEVQIEVK